MQFATLALAALAMFTGVDAQTVHAVRVGQNGTITFSPNKITARAGDMVQFMFMGGNHTVTQSPFDDACQPISKTMKNVTGIHSGYVPFAASAAMGQIPVYTIRVNNTNPIWLYCATGPHCKNGMVMVINEPTNPQRSLAEYKKAASQITGAAGVPGGPTGGQSGNTPSTGGTGGGRTGGNGGGAGTGAGGAAPSPSAGGAAPGASGTTAPVPAAGSMVAPSLGLVAVAAFSYLL
ncbi:hypothetical protein PspLS_06063 [Pyricularia sp. CBS 133598]|nr:hypothetical protein PspLS_06063 [Pyricularia sp. CBS 133598]